MRMGFIWSGDAKVRQRKIVASKMRVNRPRLNWPSLWAHCARERGQMERLGTCSGRGLGVGLRISAGHLSAGRMAGARAAARRHAGRAGAGLSPGVGGGHCALFYHARLGALYTGSAGQHRRLAGVEHVLLGVSGGVGGVVLVFVSWEFGETHRRGVGGFILLQTPRLGRFVRVGVGRFGMPARLGDHRFPVELSGRVAVGIYAAGDARAIHRRARRLGRGGLGVGGWIAFGVSLAE